MNVRSKILIEQVRGKGEKLIELIPKNLYGVNIYDNCYFISKIERKKTY